MTTLQRIKATLFPLLLLFWLFCLPLAFSIYTPFSYQSNCLWNERCERMGATKTKNSIGEITRFFRHQQDNLPPPWTIKEFQHLLEVRGIYNWVFSLFMAITLLFIIDGLVSKNARKQYHHFAKHSLFISMALLLASLLLIPFFKDFWMNVFHPLLFDNELWRTNPRDISWYLMPKTFFLRLIIFISLTTLLLNVLIWHLTKDKPASSN